MAPEERSIKVNRTENCCECIVDEWYYESVLVAKGRLHTHDRSSIAVQGYELELKTVDRSRLDTIDPGLVSLGDNDVVASSDTTLQRSAREPSSPVRHQ